MIPPRPRGQISWQKCPAAPGAWRAHLRKLHFTGGTGVSPVWTPALTARKTTLPTGETPMPLAGPPPLQLSQMRPGQPQPSPVGWAGESRRLWCQKMTSLQGRRDILALRPDPDTPMNFKSCFHTSLAREKLFSENLLTDR